MSINRCFLNEPDAATPHGDNMLASHFTTRIGEILVLRVARKYISLSTRIVDYGCQISLGKEVAGSRNNDNPFLRQVSVQKCRISSPKFER